LADSTKLVITIDTEEDNWGMYHPTGHSVENLGKIPFLQDLFDEFRMAPTYLITYPVATDDGSVAMLKCILDAGRCEIGMHCHPWNTPPFEEELNETNSMLCNLPLDLQYEKMKELHDVIKRNFHVEPKTFRAGRWGYDRGVAQNLQKLGYRVDTSVMPFTDWSSQQGPDFSRVFPRPFKYLSDDFRQEATDGCLIEVPATVGYLQNNFDLCNRMWELAGRGRLRNLRLRSILGRLNLLNKVYLSPEASDSRNMINLAEVMMKQGCGIMNLFFHSTSLKAGLSPFVKTEDEEKRFLGRIRNFLAFARSAGIEGIKLSDTIHIV